MAQTNFLIGRGELLTHDVEIRRGGQPKKNPYSLPEARDSGSPNTGGGKSV